MSTTLTVSLSDEDGKYTEVIVTRDAALAAPGAADAARYATYIHNKY